MGKMILFVMVLLSSNGALVAMNNATDEQKIKNAPETKRLSWEDRQKKIADQIKGFDQQQDSPPARRKPSLEHPGRKNKITKNVVDKG